MAANVNDGGPAFGGEIDDVYVNTEHPEFEPFKFTRRVSGMSLRDWFAGQALTGLLGSTHPDHSAPTWEAYGACAYGHADAMLKAREAK